MQLHRLHQLKAGPAHTARKPGPLFWCYALMSLQFTPIRSYACRGKWSNMRSVCFTVRLYCVPWQQIFRGSLQVTAKSILPHATIESTHLGRYTAARDWLLIALSHTLLYCVKSTS